MRTHACVLSPPAIGRKDDAYNDMPSDIFNDDMLLEYARVNFIKPPTKDDDEEFVASITAGGYEAKAAAAADASANDSLRGAVLRASDSTFKFILSQQV